MGEQELLQLSLTLRAFLYVVLFASASFVTFQTNRRGSTWVKVLGWFLLVVALINLVMFFEWIGIFYL